MSDYLCVKETLINVDNNCIFCDSEVYETYTDDRGKLYKDLVNEYGRCIGKIYIDTDDGGGAKPIGWVFVKRAKYSNSTDTYLQEAWIEVHAKMPTKTVEYHYA